MQARILRTRWLFANPAAFCSLAAAEIDAAYRIHGKRLRVRLNTFSDVPWERVAPWLFTGPRRHVRFYDYTKGWRRADKTPRNYRLTLSAGSRTPEAAISAQVARGHAVAVVFPQSRGKALPASLGPNRVIDGDRSDNRYHDRGVVVGLRAKGTMRTASRTLARP